MKLCVTSKLLKTDEAGNPVPFEEMAAFAKEAGFEELDLSLDCPMLMRKDWETELDKRMNTLTRLGIGLKYMHLPFDYPKENNPEAWEQFHTATMRGIAAMARCHVRQAAIHPRSYVTKEYDEDEEYARALQFLRPYCDEAARMGVELGIENMRGPGRSAHAFLHRFGMDIDVLIRLADELGQGICWDTGHGNISIQPQAKALRKIGRRLRLVHINDNFGEDDVHLAPFLGKINWQEVMKALGEIRYEGSLNLEVSCKNMPETMRKAYANCLAASGRRLITMFEGKSDKPPYMA